MPPVRARLTLRRALVPLALLGAAASLPAQSPPPAPPPLAIDDVVAAAGTRASGWLLVPPLGDSGTRIPITIVRGASAGPVLALVAGTQGGKAAPVVALQQLRDSLDPRTLRGTVLLVHVANVPSFLARTPYRGPWDGKNGNRVYPGRADGTVTERIAHVMSTEIVRRADYLIDLHAADANELARDFTFSARPGLDPRTDSLALQLALAWGNDHIVWDADGPRQPERATYLQTLAHLLHKPALTTMSGGLGRADPATVARNVTGALRVLRHLGMLPGTVQRVARPTLLRRTDLLTAAHTGTWAPRVSAGQRVRAGEPIGQLSDFFGEPVAELRAPFDGVVLYLSVTPAVSAGEPLVMVGSERDG